MNEKNSKTVLLQPTRIYLFVHNKAFIKLQKTTKQDEVYFWLKYLQLL